MCLCKVMKPASVLCWSERQMLMLPMLSPLADRVRSKESMRSDMDYTQHQASQKTADSATRHYGFFHCTQREKLTLKVLYSQRRQVKLKKHPCWLFGFFFRLGLIDKEP